MPNLVDLPIVGQPCKVFGGDVNALAQCNCKPTNIPFVIPSAHSLVVCGECKAIYKIVATHFDATQNQGISTAVAQVGFAENKSPVN